MISLILVMILAVCVSAAAYFRVACRLSQAEKWLTDFADLQDFGKNTALTKRLFRAIFGRESVHNRHLLRQLRWQFAILILTLFLAILLILIGFLF